MSDKAIVTQEDLEKLDALTDEQRQEKVVDGAALEAEMLEKERQKAEEFDPVEIASMMLTMYTPHFCKLVDQLSNRELRRLVKSIVEFPVGKTYTHISKLEKEAFGVGKNLLDAKYVLVANTYNDNRERILREAAEAAQAANSAEIVTEFGPVAEETKTEGSNKDGKEET